MTIDDKLKREMMQNLPPEVVAKQKEFYDLIMKAVGEYNRFKYMTNEQLANELINGPWADLPMFSEWSNLLDIVIERLKVGKE